MRADLAGALDELPRIVADNRGYRNGGALRGILALLRMLGEDSEPAARYRSELGRLKS